MRSEMFQAEMLHHQLGEMEERLRQLDTQHAEVVRLQEALDVYDGLSPGEALAPIATGLLVKVQLTADKTFFANVGDGVVVEKTLDEVRVDIAHHLEEMERHQATLHAEFDRMLVALDSLKDKFKE